MQVNCVFCKIRDRIIKTDFTYEDDDVMVFPDIRPIKPVHLLIVPKRHVADFLDFNNSLLFEKIRKTIQEMIKQKKLEDKGYRLGINGGGAQLINHFHIHLIGPMGKAAKM